MPRILLTSFDVYPPWSANSSWLALVELTKSLPTNAQLTTRRYPTVLSDMQRQLQRDLEAGFDYAIHLGQAPGSPAVLLEAVALNVYQDVTDSVGVPLEPSAPMAFHTPLPLPRLLNPLREADIPCQISYHAGTFLCNAAFFWARWIAQQLGLHTEPLMVHLPLATRQTLESEQPLASLPIDTLAQAVRTIVKEVATWGSRSDKPASSGETQLGP